MIHLGKNHESWLTYYITPSLVNPQCFILRNMPYLLIWIFLTITLQANVVINEFHYDPADETSAEEFIELHNPTNSSISLANWSVNDAISYSFPADTEIPAGGYLVISEAPEVMMARYGVVSLGPWDGGLRSTGEPIELRDGAGTLIDRVDYGAGFPWPTAARGAGASCELINPDLDNDLGGSWRSSLFPTTASPNAGPSPGQINASFSTVAPPQIRQVNHTPKAPTSNTAVVISARVTDPDGVAQVTLQYQAVAPGSYLALDDPAYNTTWTPVTMNDNGVNGDELANDDTYTATLPASLQEHRHLIRYRVIADDMSGESITVPYSDDQQQNFAYFVFDQLPSYTGSFTPSSSPNTFTPDLIDNFPIYQVIAKEQDVINSQYISDFDNVHMFGTFVFEDEVYDHIEFENRGEFSTYVSGKNKWRIHFNRARRFTPNDDWGRAHGDSTNTLNFNACASPWVPMHRGMAGIEEALSFRLYGLAGSPSPRTHFFSLRVIDAAEETSLANQYEGDLWGLYLAVEHPNGSFLDERNLADGNVYKTERGEPDQREQGDTQVSDGSDWRDFFRRSARVNNETWWRSNLDLPGYYSFRSLNRFLGNVDLRETANHMFYHEPTEDKWHVIPWDLDMMFIAETHQSGVLTQDSCLRISVINTEFKNRAREILDLMASDSAIDGGQIGQLINEYAEFVNPAGQALTWSDLDAYHWNHHPRTNGTLGVTSGQRNHLGNFFQTPYEDVRIGGSYDRILSSPDHEGFVDYMLTYTTDNFTGGTWRPGNGVPAGYGYEYLAREATDNEIPETPNATYTGPANFPVDNLTFSSNSFMDQNDPTSFGKIRWRVARISAPGLAGYRADRPRIYELETLFSEESETFNSSYTFPADICTPGFVYRVRVQHEDNTGRTSHWSPPVQFIAGEPDLSGLRDNLVISEIMDHPPNPTGPELRVSDNDDDFEFIELANISTSQTLDLSAISFTDGIGFNFGESDFTELAPGEHVLLVRDLTAFETRYGANLPVAGEYSGALSNSMDELTLSFSENTTLINLTYTDESPWPEVADGDGPSLILLNPDQAPDHSVASNWGTSNLVGGTPGLPEDAIGFYNAWLSSHFTATEQEDIGLVGLNSDPDGDGLVNLMELALGANPNAQSPEPLIRGFLTSEGGDDYPALSFARLTGSSDVAYFVQTSTTLQNWSTLAGTTTSVINNGNGTETVTIRSNQPVANAREFLRLMVRLTENNE